MIDNKLKTVLIASLSVPVSLLIWVIHGIFFKIANEQNEERNNRLTILRAFVATSIPFLLMIYAYNRKSVNKSGGIFGLICSIILSLTSMIYFLDLAAFFFSGSKATKFRESEKSKIEKDFKSGGQRNWMQVLCNAGFPTFLALTQLIEGMFGERPIDFQENFIGSVLGIGVMSSFACCCGDTLASELSPVIAKSDPILITTGKKVPKGTNGGITLEGLFFSLLGGLLVGFSHWACTLLLVDKSEMNACITPQYPIILLGGISGLFGSLIDSILGATCQYSGQTDEGYIVEHPGKGIKKISGYIIILNNHTVNLLSTIFTGLFISLISVNFWIPFTHSY